MLSESPDLWSNQQKAQAVLKEKNYLQNALGGISRIESDFAAFMDLIAMSEEMNDEATLLEAEQELKALSILAKKQEVECLFSGEVDGNDTFIEIHSGAGGTESHDWASMLLRMYCAWAESHKYSIELIDKLDGEEAGIKSVTLKIVGFNAYGWLKTESGIHRLVRISPFNAAGKRHTSFASVWVYPVIDETVNIEINEVDLRVDTYRASGAGGQHVNKTDSAVRITHLPTNIVVQSQNSRSQHKNRDECYKMLRSRLYELEMQKRMDATNAQNASKSDIGWGHQIRSYVLQPYQIVKDLRTSYEDGDAQGVLNGKLDEFMRAMLEKMTAGQGLSKDKK